MNFSNTFSKAMKTQLYQVHRLQLSMLIKAWNMTCKTKLFEFIIRLKCWQFFIENSKIETLHSNLYDIWEFGKLPLQVSAVLYGNAYNVQIIFLTRI